MKRVKYFAVVLMVWPYLGLVLLSILDKMDPESYGNVFAVYVILTIVVYVMNIANACTCRGAGADYQLAFWDMLIKLIHIPFYILVFLTGVLLLFAMVVPALIFISPIMVTILAVIDYLLLLTSSAYDINAVARAKKKGAVSAKYAVLHSVLHLFFIADLISSIVIFVRFRRK